MVEEAERIEVEELEGIQGLEVEVMMEGVSNAD